MKAQSAIEYVTTYGWALLTIAIVSGTVYSLIGDQCVDSTSGFTSQTLDIENFGLQADSTDLALELSNSRTETVNITEIRFESENSYRNKSIGEVVDPGSNDAVEVTGFTQASSCNSFDITIEYDIGDLSDRTATGTITSNIQFDNTELPEPLQSVQVTS